MLDRNIETKEPLDSQNPNRIMDDKLSVLVQMLSVELKQDDWGIVSENYECIEQEIINGFFGCKNISSILPPKLGKCPHVQVLSFDIVFHYVDEPEEEDGENQRDDESVDSVLGICFIHLKLNLHANLTLDTVLGKSSSQLLRKRENSEGNATQGKESNPVKRIKKLVINSSLLN